ncbi:MAG TPA: winged helix-turn-helix domain-containing protein, partial [Ilumatobacter sp.]
MEYRVLGKLEVVRDGQVVDVGAFRQRALLALLLTAPNSVFSTDRILDELWGADGGIDKQNALWVYVSGLRKALEPQREKRTDGTILLTRAPGYLIQAAADQVDALRFERMVSEGRALIDVEPGAASLVLGEALALWRGLPFEDFTYE